MISIFFCDHQNITHGTCSLCHPLDPLVAACSAWKTGASSPAANAHTSELQHANVVQYSTVCRSVLLPACYFRMLSVHHMTAVQQKRRMLADLCISVCEYKKSLESLQQLYLSTAVCGNGATIVLLKVVSGGSKCTTLHLQW
jgi:hypothetical protein